MKMKKLSFLSIVLVLAVSASGQTPQTSQTYIAPAQSKRARKAAQTPPIGPRESRGALQRGMRGGNVLQMFNLKAPPQYGTYSDSLIIDETGKWRGIKFIEIAF